MNDGLTTAGLIFVIIAWTSILIVTIFCFWKVLVSKRDQWEKTDSAEIEDDL
ncbi:MAG: hypothetical protein ONB33_03740 [candidate division KSB1 bacterium]|nr:hypothetical protein [candidate division KSB1 bacterium]MDZ7398609.1 hypothetical protein [candidate division KSB1 bacterium]